MYQIAIGDSVSGFTVIEGASIAAPALKATVHFTFSAQAIIEESIDLQLKGTMAQISTLLSTLESVISHAVQYEMGSYPSPQFLRFQRTAGEGYYYTPISNIYLEANPAGYLHQPQGSKMVIIHYTRPNHFDGAAVELPLSGRAGNDITGGYTLRNFTATGVGLGSTVLMKKTDLSTALPAPLRIEYKPATAAVAYRDLMFGLYHHPSYDSDTIFFKYYSDITGGTNHVNAGAIEGNFKRQTWAAAVWNGIWSFGIGGADLAKMYGFTYRTVLRLFTTHAYTDLYFKIAVEHGSYALYTSEAVHSPPNVGYVYFPPIELPPNYLLREIDPADLSIVIYALRESGAATTVETDCITLFPLSHAATFYGYYYLVQNQLFIDDSSRERHNFRTTGAGVGESMGHARVGGPLLVPPNVNARLFVYAVSSAFIIDPAIAAFLQVFYYPRIRLL